MDEKLKTILANIESLVSQAKQMSGGEQGQEGTVEEAQDDNSVTSDEVEKIMKLLKDMNAPEQGGDAIKKADGEDEGSAEDKKEDEKEVAKSDEGTHGDDKAQAIIDDQGEVNEKNISEVAKAIANVLKTQRASKVQKSSVDATVVKVLEGLAAENREIKKTMETLLDGFGLTKTVKEANAVKKAQDVKKPDVDLNALKKSIMDDLKTETGVGKAKNTGWGMDTMQTGGSSVRKSIGEAISSLIGKND